MRRLYYIRKKQISCTLIKDILCFYNTNFNNKNEKI
jgi:hypothetical protein